MSIVLVPGKCYTFIAVTRGQAEISLTLELDAPPILPGPMPPLATAKKAGSSVTLAPGASCFKIALPIPVQARIVARTDNPVEVLLGAFAK
jgi:hypothetical protein